MQGKGASYYITLALVVGGIVALVLNQLIIGVGLIAVGVLGGAALNSKK